jgi:uncharacterized membrane protein (UPF0127 family)
VWQWLPQEGTQRVTLVNERTGYAVASSVELALTRRARRVGLLGQTSLDPTVALVLAPCFMIHTAFMRFPIDVLFVNRNGYAVRLVHGMRPWRMTASAGAYAAIELAAGVLERGGVAVGDRFILEPSASRDQSQRIV